MPAVSYVVEAVHSTLTPGPVPPRRGCGGWLCGWQGQAMSWRKPGSKAPSRCRALGTAPGGGAGPDLDPSAFRAPTGLWAGTSSPHLTVAA